MGGCSKRMMRGLRPAQKAQNFDCSISGRKWDSRNPLCFAVVWGPDADIATGGSFKTSQGMVIKLAGFTGMLSDSNFILLSQEAWLS